MSTKTTNLEGALQALKEGNTISFTSHPYTVVVFYKIRKFDGETEEMLLARYSLDTKWKQEDYLRIPSSFLLDSEDKFSIHWD